MLYKSLKIDVENIKQKTVNGVKVGIVRGFASTPDIDRVNDIIIPGAFREKLDELIALDSEKALPMFFEHNSVETIGGFPLKLMSHNEKGLFVEGHINLDIEKGREKFSLAKQNIFSFSVGFNIIKSVHEDDDEERITVIHAGDLMEISIVPIAANVNAIITQVKGATPFKDLPLASFERSWDADAANTRVRTKTDSVESPSREYRNAFFWFDASNADKFSAYKLPFVDVIDGELKAVPRGIFAAAGALQGARGGVDIPASDRPRVINHVNRYYKKMDRESPLEKSSRKEIDSLSSIRDCEDYLRDTGLSHKNTKDFIHKIKIACKNNEYLEDLKLKLKDLHLKIGDTINKI